MGTGSNTSSLSIKWELIVIFICILIFFGCAAIALVPDVVKSSMSSIFEGAVIFFNILFGVLTVFALVAIGRGMWLSIETILHQRAERRKVEHEAEVLSIVAPADNQVFIHSWKEKRINNLTLDAQSCIIPGQPSTPSIEERQAWAAYHLLHATRHVGKQEINQLLAPPEESGPVQLLTAMDDIDRALIVGASGSGKTTLMQHLMARRQGHVLVIDPHDDKRTWPDNVQVIGGGQNYDLIERALIALVQEIRNRYQQRATGEVPQFAPLAIFVDEWREITLNTQHAADNLKVVLTGGRKVATACIVASHSERARPLGLEGEADLKDGFGIVRLFGNRQVGFTASLDTGSGEMPVLLPGPFNASRPSGQVIIDPERVQLPMSGVEQLILNAWDQGHRSITKIGVMAYGSKGGQQNDLVREVLKNHGKL